MSQSLGDVCNRKTARVSFYFWGWGAEGLRVTEGADGRGAAISDWCVCGVSEWVTQVGAVLCIPTSLSRLYTR